MGLYAIDEAGTIRWNCHNSKRKGCPPQFASLSNDAVRWSSADMIALPPCGNCGSQMSLKVSTNDEEREAPNMQEYGMVPQKRELPHAITGQMIPVLIPELMPIGRNPWHARNDELARQMRAAGKLPWEEEHAHVAAEGGIA